MLLPDMNVFDLPVTNFSVFEKNNRKYFQAFVCANDFPRSIPIEANLRHPNKSSTTYQNIVATLIDNPAQFLDSNLGLRISAEYCEVVKIKSKQFLRMTINKGQGIANGSHTYFALHTASINGANLSEAYLSVIIQVGLDEQELPIICARLNTITKVDNRSIGFKRGVYNNLRALLENNNYHRIAYFQNQSHSLSKSDLLVSRDKRCSVNHIVELLRCLDTTAWSCSRHPLSLVGGGFPSQGNAINRACELFDCFDTAFWVEKETCLRIVKDLELSDFTLLAGARKVSNNCNIQSCSHFADGSVLEIIINASLVFPIIGAFRAFMTEEGWEFNSLEFRQDLLKELYPIYKSFLQKGHRNGETMRALLGSPAIWSTLYIKALEFKTRYLQKKYAKAS